MSSINLVKSTDEVVTIEIPDYQPRLDTIDELKATSVRAIAESTRTVKALGGSIVEQIANYLNEVLKPLIEYCDKNDMDIPDTMYWCICGWFLCRESDNNYRHRSLKFQYKKDGCIPDLEISFDMDGYHIVRNECGSIRLSDLASRWKDFKKGTHNVLDRTMENLQYEQERKIRQSNDIIKSLANFEL